MLYPTLCMSFEIDSVYMRLPSDSPSNVVDRAQHPELQSLLYGYISPRGDFTKSPNQVIRQVVTFETGSNSSS